MRCSPDSVEIVASVHSKLWGAGPFESPKKLPGTPTASSVAANPVLARTDGNWQECFILPRRLYRPHSSRTCRHPWTGPGALTSISARSAALSVIPPAAAFCTTYSALVAPPTTTGDLLELVI